MSGGHLLSRLFGRPRRPRSVTVGSWTRIGQDVVLGERVRLGDWSHIGDGSRIGEDCVFGPWARVGSNVTLGARVRLGSHIRGGGVRLPLRFDPEDFPVLDFDCDPGSFLRWPERTHTLLIIENEAPFRTLTPRPGYALAWGSGHAARASLPELPVADHLRLLYWGDCDSHGYAILNGLRRDLPHLRPVGMGTETVQSHEGALIPEADPERIETSMPFLGPDEAMARMLLLGRRARLEQERVRVPEADLFPS